MKTNLKIALLGSTLLLAPTASFAQAVPAAVVAVVDTQRVFAECAACKAAATQIQGLVTSAQQRAQTLSAPIQTEGQALNTEANRIRALPAGAARTAAEQAFQQRAQAFEARQQTAQRELAPLEQNIQSVRANVVRQINEKLYPIYQTVMQQRGANIALDQQATLAAAKTIDVTNDVLAQLNAQLPSVSVTPLPQQAAPAAPAPATPAAPKPPGR